MIWSFKNSAGFDLGESILMSEQLTDQMLVEKKGKMVTRKL